MRLPQYQPEQDDGYARYYKSGGNSSVRPSNASPLRPITNNKGFLEPAIIPPLGTRDQELQSLIKEQNKVRDKIAELDESQRIEPKYMKARPWLYMNSEKKEDQKYEKYTAVDDD